MISFSPRMLRYSAAIVSCIAPFFLLSSLHGAPVIYEDYESYTVGTGTYTGQWKFIFANPPLDSRSVSNLDIGNGALGSIDLFSGSRFQDGVVTYIYTPLPTSLDSPAG